MIGNLYIITNTKNDKVYIGKTYQSIEERFKSHINESKKERSKNRDIYIAMREIGIENFSIHLLGQYEEGVLEEKECEYIEKYDSYHNGYNQTLGGDGKRYIEWSDEEIIETYKEQKTIKNTALKLGCCRDTIQDVLRNNNIDTSSAKKRKIKCSNGMEFDSISDASRWLIKKELTHGSLKHSTNSIVRVLKGERKSYLKMTWEYI